MDLVNLDNTKPFPHFFYTLGILPTSFKMSLTYEEQMMEIIKFIRDEIIPNLNKNTLATIELQTKFQELVNYVDTYFDNLDLQEEVNTKLDDMVESGELEEIITAYLNIKGIMAYNSVSEMKQATNLINGSFVETYGFYAANDGGNAKYKIREVTNQDVVDEILLFALSDNQLIAELVIDKSINVKSIGCNDDVDCGEILSTLDENLAKPYSLYFPIGEYTFESTFTSNYCQEIKGEGAKSILYANDDSDLLVFENDYVSISNVYIKNTLESVTEGNGIVFNKGTQCKIDKIKIEGFYNNIVVKRHSYSSITNSIIQEWEQKGIVFENVPAPDTGDSIVAHCTLNPLNRGRSNNIAIFNSSGGGLRIENNKINWYTTGYQPNYGIVLQPTANVVTFDLFIIGNSIENCSTCGINIDVSASSSSFSQIIINGNEISGYNNEGKGIKLNGVASTGNSFTLKDVIINDNIISQFDTGIEFSYINNLNINNNSYRNNNTCILRNGNANNIVIDEKMFSLSQNKLLFNALYGADNKENPNGIIKIKDELYTTTKTGNAYKIDMAGYSTIKGKATLKGMAQGVGAVYQETEFFITYSNGNVNITLTPLTDTSSQSGYCQYAITETRDQAAHTVTLGYNTENNNVTALDGTFEIEIYGYKPKKITRLL